MYAKDPGVQSSSRSQHVFTSILIVDGSIPEIMEIYIDPQLGFSKPNIFVWRAFSLTHRCSLTQRWKLERIMKPGAKPRFHETAVSDATQFHCVKRKFFKLLGFGIAVSRNWILAAWNWICCGFIYRSRFHQESHLQLRPNYTISLAIHVTSDGDITMLSLKM